MYKQIESPQLDSFKECVPEFNGCQIVDCRLQIFLKELNIARIIHELALRDCEDERATGQPQGLEFEAYLYSTSQDSRPEDARKDVYIHSRSSRFMNYPG